MAKTTKQTHKCTQTSTCVGDVTYEGATGTCDSCGAIYVMSGTDISDDVRNDPPSKTVGKDGKN
jgi:hypothetical protein